MCAAPRPNGADCRFSDAIRVRVVRVHVRSEVVIILLCVRLRFHDCSGSLCCRLVQVSFFFATHMNRVLNRSFEASSIDTYVVSWVFQSDTSKSPLATLRLCSSPWSTAIRRSRMHGYSDFLTLINHHSSSSSLPLQTLFQSFTCAFTWSITMRPIQWLPSPFTPTPFLAPLSPFAGTTSPLLGRALIVIRPCPPV